MAEALPSWQALVRAFSIGGLALLAASCSANLGTTLPDPNGIDLRAKNPGPVRRPQTSDPASNRGSYQLYPGQPQQPRGLGGGPGVEKTGDKYTINVDAAEVGQVAKLILGDTLGYSYVVDPRVQGTITLSTGRPLAEDEVLSALEAALRMNGAVLIKSEGYYKVVPLQEVLEGEMGSADLGTPGGNTTPGYGVSVVPLRFISTASMLELLDSFIARSGSVRAANNGNLILLRGSADERQSLVDVVLSFDVDWMRSQSASIAILANSSPEEMVAKLEAIFAQDSVLSGSNSMRVIPLERLNGILLIANNQEKVRRALSWVGRLDRASTSDTNYYVYAVQNGNAVDLAKILNATFLEKSGEETLTSEVDPSQEATQTSTEDQQQQQDNQQTRDDQTTTGKNDRQDGTDTAQTPTDTSVDKTVKTDLSSGIRITPNAANNTIVIRATPREYRKILNTLRQIDSPVVQVLINTTIAEVSLNDNLRYGVQAYFKDGDVKGGIFNGNSLRLRPSFPGLNFLLGSTTDPSLVIDALAKVTKVKIVSSPSIVVLENETATIKVGDQVPVRTGTVSGQIFTESFEYRDTGVILKVKPRVNADGLVTMQIGQELSSVTGGTADTTTPTISQRTINSTVSVYSTQTVVLGGLITGQETRDKNSVPGINKIPLIGDLVGRTNNEARRNELIVFITPQIVQSGKDAATVSEELRSKMKLFEWQ